MGTVNGSFTTTYGTLAANPWLAGTGTLAATVDATPLSYVDVGPTAGTNSGAVWLIIYGQRTDGTIDAVVLVVDPALYFPGATVPVDWGSAQGVMWTWGGTAWVLVGYIFNGSVHFDQAGTTTGAPVSGTFQGELLIPPP